MSAQERTSPLSQHLPNRSLDAPASCAGGLYVGIYVALKLIGWLLATAIAVAVSTRAEALVARNEE